MPTMDQQTHSFAVRVAIIAVAIILVVGFADYCALAWQHDGAYATNLFNLVGASLICLLILILGVPVVAQLLQLIGIRFPGASAPAPAPAPTDPTTPADPAAPQSVDVNC